MPYVKVWLHFVWATKNREAYLTDDIRLKVFQHIRENARERAFLLISSTAMWITCIA